jgi:hypothetical protein
MSKDEAEGPEGHGKAPSSSLTVSRQLYGSGIELTLDDDDEDNDNDNGERGSVSDGGDVADASRHRVSIVEASLCEVLHLDENPGPAFDEARLESIANKSTEVEARRRTPVGHSHVPHAFPCKDTNKSLPAPPSLWPQRPLMIRPTPYTSTKVIGMVRPSVWRRSSTLQNEKCCGSSSPVLCLLFLVPASAELRAPTSNTFLAFVLDVSSPSTMGGRGRESPS